MTGRRSRVRRIGLVSAATLLHDPAYRLGAGLELKPVQPGLDATAMGPLLADCLAVVAGPEPYRRDLLSALPELCLIARAGVGYDQIELQAASELGIHVTVTGGVNADVVAEHALGLALAVLHRIPHYDRRVRGGQWRDGSFFRELHGLTVGIVGFGQVGRKLSRLLRPFDARVLVHDVVRPGTHLSAVTYCRDLHAMLPLCDVLSVHVPLTDQTRGMFGTTELGMLPNGAILVNTSRGGIVNEVALADALRTGHLAGAALDVFEIEPPSDDNELLTLNNCVLSPHIASFGSHTIGRMTELVIDQVNCVCEGREPPGLVNAPSRPRFPGPIAR